MARIRAYDSEVSAGAAIGGRAATAEDFGASAALANVGQAAAKESDILYDAAQRQEVSHVRANLAKARADWTVNLQQRASSADPGDPNFASGFTQDFSDYMSTFGDGVATEAGRRAFEEGKAELTAHFVQAAGLTQVQLAGVKARQDAESALDNDRNTLLADPTQFDSILRSWDQTVGDPNSFFAKMPPEAREKFARTSKGDLAVSALEGMTNLNPDLAERQLASGKFDTYLDADKKFALGQHIKTAKLAQEAEKERLRVAQERAQRQAAMATENVFVQKLVEDPTKVSAKDIASSNMTPEQKLTWVRPGGILDQALKEGDDHDTELYGSSFLDLWRRVTTDGPDKIADETELNSYVGNGLTVAGLSVLRAEAQGKRTLEGAVETELKKELEKTARSAITGTNQALGLHDPNGDRQMLGFMAWFLPEYQKQRAAGKTALQLLDPKSPDYMGAGIDRYKRRPDVYLHDLLESNPGQENQILGNAPAGNVAARATNTARRGNETIYLVNGRWLRADGTEYK